MRLAFLCCLLGFAALSGATQAHARTCLVLGGGGARGAAHIGVLKVLEREHVAIDCITGTSMGAIVGGLYAAGYDAEAIEVVLKGIDWKDMFRDDPPRQELPMRRKEDELRFLGGIELGLKDGSIALPRGMIQGQKLQLLLRRLLLSTGRVQTFDDLPIPFRSIATDIGNGEKVVFSDGDLAMAIRASMSVPGAFAPVRYRGRLMVDGGIVDNIPIDVARGLGATRLIVVSVGEPLAEEDKLNSPFSIANQMLTTLMKRESDAQLSTLGDADVLLVPDLGDVGSADFQRAGDAVAAGVASAEGVLDKLRRYAVSDADYAAFRARHNQREFDAPLIEFVDVLRGRSRTAAYVEQRLSDNVGKTFDAKAIESDIGLAYGDGSYERITYQLEERDGKTGLAVHPVDKGWGPNFLRFGLRLSDDFAGRNSYQLTGEVNFTGLNERGGESRNRIQLGRITGVHSEFYQPFGDHGQYYVAPYLDYSAYNFPLGSGIETNSTFAEFRRSRSVAAVELGYTPDATWRFAGTFKYGYDELRRRIGAPDLPGSISQTFGGIKLQVTRDSLDDSGFPSRGSRVDLSNETLVSELGSESSTANVWRFNWDTAFSSGPNRWLVGARVHSAGGNGDLLSTFGTLGGLANLSGFTENQLIATQTVLGRVVYYRRLTDATKLISVPVYAGASLEAGGIWDSRDDVRGKDLIGAGSLFVGVDTFLGPVFLGYGHAQGGNNSFYLTFGSLLRSSDD